ncbi:hypothetical protein NDU88_004407 [Pleurodeles waltl]|uniref:Uncharacterized protein n=1 Tax=Pleurodeles waltl TaxID=8319 RepID=A0AAV7WUJ7_PLEWA|nr:hypothetical protein NDU88_004407 [Pleurodeles waltl]
MRLGWCDRDPPRVQDRNGQKSPEPSLHYPRWTNEGITLYASRSVPTLKEEKRGWTKRNGMERKPMQTDREEDGTAEEETSVTQAMRERVQKQVRRRRLAQGAAERKERNRLRRRNRGDMKEPAASQEGSGFSRSPTIWVTHCGSEQDATTSSAAEDFDHVCSLDLLSEPLVVLLSAEAESILDLIDTDNMNAILEASTNF